MNFSLFTLTAGAETSDPVRTGLAVFPSVFGNLGLPELWGVPECIHGEQENRLAYTTVGFALVCRAFLESNTSCLQRSKRHVLRWDLGSPGPAPGASRRATCYMSLTFPVLVFPNFLHEIPQETDTRVRFGLSRTGSLCVPMCALLYVPYMSGVGVPKRHA